MKRETSIIEHRTLNIEGLAPGRCRNSGEDACATLKAEYRTSDIQHRSRETRTRTRTNIELAAGTAAVPGGWKRLFRGTEYVMLFERAV